MGPYPGAGNGPPPGLPHPPAHAQGPPVQPQHISNSNFAGSGPSAALAHSQNGMNGTAAGPLPPFSRNSPRAEMRPLLDHRDGSPRTSYTHPQRPPFHAAHPDAAAPSGSIESAAPTPSHPAADTNVAPRSDDRPPSVGPKRMREWEEEHAIKKPETNETRARMDDVRHRRPSTPPRESFRRGSSEARRQEDQRRADEHRRINDNYHPSEAAHHPPQHALPPPTNHLPPLQQGSAPPTHEASLPPPPPQAPMGTAPAVKDFPPEESKYAAEERERERGREHPSVTAEPERAARKMDVDEDYDDDGEEEKKVPPVSAPSSTNGDKATSPTTNGVNGHGPVVNGSSAVTKVEAAA